MDTARRRLAREDSDEDASPFTAAADVAANKIARFEGQKKKSKFELAREAEAEKARKEAEEAARAYQDFVATFGGEEEEGPSTGSRPRVGGGSARSAGKGFVKAGGEERYNPLANRPPPPPPTAPSGPAIPTGPRVPSGPRAMYGQPPARSTAASLMADDDEPDSLVKPSVTAGKKKREGANFLEQLKREQAAREERLKQTAGRIGSSVTALAAREHAPVLTGSYDNGDPLTTNVHVGGLPLTVTEDALGKLFAQFGPVGSVKIMWPRMDTGQLAVGTGGRKLGGFVAFLRRPDAERAAKEMDGAEWGESVLKTGWGKAVPIPARAAYEPDPDSSYHRDHGSSSHRRRRSRSRSRSRTPEDPADILLRSKRPRSRSPPPSASSSKVARAWPELEEGVEDKFLTTVAKKVRDNGKAFEDVLRDKERENPRFAFLVNEALPSYHYFRMLIDPSYEPPQVATFEDEGSADVYSSDSSEDSDNERVGKGKLGKVAQRRFENLLRGLTSSRDKIARGMSFALEHADCAAYIADILVCSLTIDSTPVPRKLARLHLVSDILHNAAASVPNAWVYRSIFESKLPVVFDHLGDIYLSFPGRLKAEQFKGLIEKVIDVWANDWILFEPAVIEDFKRRLSGLDVAPSTVTDEPLPDDMVIDDSFSSSHAQPSASVAPIPAEDAPAAPEAPSRSGFKKSAFKAAAFAPAAAEPAEPVAEPATEVYDDDVDGAAVVMDDVDGAAVGTDDLDGAALDGEDVDGAALVAGEDVDGAIVEMGDVDGAPVAAAEAMDGAPVGNGVAAGQALQTVTLDDDEDGEAMEMGSDEDDIFQ
ncbi:hypothetical protein JCM11251_006601 [Rhodosporidiobolus azoricus]